MHILFIPFFIIALAIVGATAGTDSDIDNDQQTNNRSVIGAKK